MKPRIIKLLKWKLWENPGIFMVTMIHILLQKEHGLCHKLFFFSPKKQEKTDRQRQKTQRGDTRRVLSQEEVKKHQTIFLSFLVNFFCLLATILWKLTIRKKGSRYGIRSHRYFTQGLWIYFVSFHFPPVMFGDLIRIYSLWPVSQLLIQTMSWKMYGYL